MAGDWIKWTKGLARRREVLGIAVRLSIAPAHAAGLCMLFWEWLDDNVTGSQVDDHGNAHVTLGSLQPDFIDSLVCASGFAAALTAEGWLCLRSGSLAVPNFCRHNGQTAKQRVVTSERVGRFRASKCNAATVTCVTPDALPEKSRVDIKPPVVPRGTKAGDDDASQPSYSVAFLQFWELYPPLRRQGKRGAWKAWQAAIKRASSARILSAAREFAASPLGKSRYCPGPTPWLHQDRWEDDRAAWQRGGEPAGPAEPVDEPYPEH